MTAPPTADDVAAFMVEELQRRNGHLCQDDIVWTIKQKYGDAFVTNTERGNFGIDPAVRRAFRKRTKGRVDWMKPDRCWRLTP